MRKNKYLIYLFSVSIQHRTSDVSVRVSSAFLYIRQYGDDPSPFLNREEARHKLHVCVVRLCRTSTSYDTEGPCLRVSGVLGQLSSNTMARKRRHSMSRLTRWYVQVRKQTHRHTLPSADVERRQLANCFPADPASLFLCVLRDISA
ncbi:hypothetical protein TNCV_82931 [Trichonephila clavipes]|nr:hypothetical protein TNCV_82931 [Trichonephila clavipes]